MRSLYPPFRGEDIPLSIFTDEYRLMLRLLREARRTRKFTQGEVARGLGITQSIIGKIERGERRIDVIELKDYCGVIGMPLILFVHQLESALEKESGK